MGKFEVGQRVVVTPDDGCYRDIERGVMGVVLDIKSEASFPYIVELASGRSIVLKERELAPAPTDAPQDAGAGDTALPAEMTVAALEQYAHEALSVKHHSTAFDLEREQASKILWLIEYVQKLVDKNADLRAQLAAANKWVDTLARALKDAESALYRIQTRLPDTDSYKDVNRNRAELREIAAEYFKTHPAKATAADGKGE